jgi:hypothetical protein
MSTDTNEAVPAEAQAQLRAAVDTALSSPTQAQGFLGLPGVDLSNLGDFKSKAAGALDTVLGAIDTLQQFGWLIPGQYAAGIQKLEDALRKVRGWLG